MSKGLETDITQILRDWNDDDADAKERLLPYVYEELRRQARLLMTRERVNHTLQPTALVHEAFLRLSKLSDVEWKDRGHFFGIASRLMRQILVDHARSHTAGKRGGNVIHFSTDELQIPIEDRATSILAIDEALEKLAKLDQRQVKIVEMRFFAGMTNEEIADSLDVSQRTVSRDWETARLWLYRELKVR